MKPRPDDVAPTASGAPALIDATAGRIAAALFGLASRGRGRRSLHPDGAGFEATLTVDPARSFGSRLIDEPGDHRCLVRLSRAVGLPERYRDILGLAVRVLDADGATVQDLLFSSVAGDGPITRHLLAPTRSFAGGPLSTILSYRTPAARLTLVARGGSNEPDLTTSLEFAAQAFTDHELVFALQACVDGTLTGLGHLCGGRRLSVEETEALCFNPYHAAADLQPAGVLNALRRRAYAASQRGRGAGRPGAGARRGAAIGSPAGVSSAPAAR